ncbi:MAG: hypothetical protein EZS28_051982, partial [Streblomastix strix]
MKLLSQVSQVKQITTKQGRGPVAIDVIAPLFILPSKQAGVIKYSTFTHSNKADDCTIGFDPVIKDGVVRFEVMFENSQGCERSIGIADASCSFNTDQRYWNED